MVVEVRVVNLFVRISVRDGGSSAEMATSPPSTGLMSRTSLLSILAVFCLSVVVYRYQAALWDVHYNALAPLYASMLDRVFPPRPHPAFSHNIVAVGDLHGDLPNALQVLRMAGVIDKSGDWSGNIDTLVQTGDIIDRYNVLAGALLGQFTHVYALSEGMIP